MPYKYDMKSTHLNALLPRKPFHLKAGKSTTKSFPQDHVARPRSNAADCDQPTDGSAYVLALNRKLFRLATATGVERAGSRIGK